MALERGVVSGINRAAGLVSVDIPGRTRAVPAYFLGDPPPPRSVVVLDKPTTGAWIVVGVEGPVRRVFHDDFIAHGLKGNVVFVFVPVHTDTHWWYGESAAGPSIDASNLVGTGDDQRFGQIKLVTDATNGRHVRIIKALSAAQIGYPVAGGALWLHACVAISSTASVACKVGFQDNTLSAVWAATAAGYRQIAVVFDTAGGGSTTNWVLDSTVDTNTTITDTGVPVVADQWYSIDLVVIPGVFAAAYIDGAPAVYHFTNIPDYATTNFGPTLNLLNRTNSARNFHCDRYSLTWVGSVVTP